MIPQPHFWAYIWKNILICKDTRALMFTAALFIIAETWKQPSWILIRHLFPGDAETAGLGTTLREPLP